MSFENILTDDF